MRRIEAQRMIASLLWGWNSSSLLKRRFFDSHANVRSTIQRLGKTTKPFWSSSFLTIAPFHS